MNKNKNSKIMLVLSILLLFLIIGSVSATDETSNETVSTTTNDDGVDTLNTEVGSVDEKASTADNLGSSDASNKDSTLESTNNELLSENPFNWTVLKKEITGKESVTLSHDYYKYVTGDENQINLTGIKVLDGNGATIDADNKTDVYPFRSNGNITIKNINFINVVSSTAEVANSFIGGPIHFSVGSSNVIFDNCNFTKLTSTKNDIAGAIGLPKSHNITIKNCNFYNNTVYNTLIIFFNSGFTNENITISDCKFDNINSTNANGILWANNLRNFTLKNCEFTYNTPLGSLIYLGTSYNVTIGDCKIDNSTHRAIQATLYYCNISNCNFTNITENAAGGALNLKGYNITVRKCNFIDTKCTAGNGGAVLLDASDYNCTIEYCNFTRVNTSVSGALNFANGAHHNYVLYCDFTDCSAGYFGGPQIFRGNGGAIEFYTRDSVVDHCNFIRNSVFANWDRDGIGGAIVLYSGANNVNITNCEFIDNYAVKYGGAIGSLNANCLYTLIENCTFIGNNASAGGAVYYKSQYTTIKNCNFENNTAIGNQTTVDVTGGIAPMGGAIYANAANSYIGNCTIRNNAAVDTNITGSSGGGIFANAQNSQIEDCTIENNTASIGKNLYASKQGTITLLGVFSDEFYIKNQDGGDTSFSSANGFTCDNPVEWTDDLIKYFKPGSKITFIIVDTLDNFTEKVLDTRYNDIIIKGYTKDTGFKNLDHTVFNIGADHVTLDGLTFQNITDNVIVNNADGTNIKNCVFTGNNATGNGSCILGQSKGDNLIIDNCTFTANNATNGGAIYIKNTTNTSQILNCKFTNNHAKEYGGAIYIDEGMYYYIFEPKYEGNTAGLKDKDASIDRALAMLPVIYASFTGNDEGSDANHPMNIYLAFTAVAPNGKIIFAKSGDIINYNQAVVREFGKSNVTFIGNNTTFVDVQFYANSYARNTKLYNIIFVNYTQTAIKSESTDNLIQNCKFINCTHGCIIVTGDGSKAVNCTFENNTLDGNGTCILIDAKHITIEDSTFTGNNATGNGGAIYVTKDASDINLVNSKFNENNATLGGAVYNNGVLTIKESSSFTGNNATMGGAVYNNATLTINGADFTGNNATMGGAVFSNTKITITGSDFTGNSAVYGGALFLNASDNVLTGLRFERNNAGIHGSAIYVNGTGNIKLDTISFNNNQIDNVDKEAVYFAEDNYVSSNDLTFTVDGDDLNIVVADGVVLTSPVVYVTVDGKGQGIVSGEGTSLTDALNHVVAGSTIYLEHGNYYLSDALKFNKNQVTIVGNGSTIIRNDKKSLFNNSLTHIKSCS